MPLRVKSEVNVQKTPSPVEAVPPNQELKTSGEEKAVKRDVPKIMKWDQLEDRKKA